MNIVRDIDNQLMFISENNESQIFKGFKLHHSNTNYGEFELYHIGYARKDELFRERMESDIAGDYWYFIPLIME